MQRWEIPEAFSLKLCRIPFLFAGAGSIWGFRCWVHSGFFGACRSSAAMVYKYKCSDPRYEVYSGKDKFENEVLLAHGWPEDVWFHVDRFSSAHFYLRTPQQGHQQQQLQLQEVPDIQSIPEQVLKEVAQLTKANSIEGRKQLQTDVVYTAWSNLKKTSHMDIGQVGFKDPKAVYRLKHVSLDRELLRTLEKTQEELNVNWKEAREIRDREQVLESRRRQREARAAAAEAQRRQQEEKQLRSYETLQQFKEDGPSFKGDGTIDSCKAIEEDFM